MNVLDYLLRCAIAGILLIPWYLIGAIVALMDNETGLRVFIGWNQFLLKLIQISVSVENENDAEFPFHGCVFTLLNQTSLLDGSIGATVIPLPWRGLVNIEYALIPIFGWAMCIFSWIIIRQWPKQTKKTFQKVESFLQKGGNLWISIEGRRSKDGVLSPYKKGPVVFAINSKSQIIPVIHSGARDCLSYGEWRIRPGKVTVRLLKAIPTENVKYEDRLEVIRKLRKIARLKLLGEKNKSIHSF